MSAANQQAEGMFPRVWGADSLPGFRGDRIAGQFLAAGENLALRKLRFSLRPSTALLPDIVFGYKVDISKTKGGYKVDTIISNL